MSWFVAEQCNDCGGTYCNGSELWGYEQYEVDLVQDRCRRSTSSSIAPGEHYGELSVCADTIT